MKRLGSSGRMEQRRRPVDVGRRARAEIHARYRHRRRCRRWQLPRSRLHHPVPRQLGVVRHRDRGVGERQPCLPAADQPEHAAERRRPEPGREGRAGRQWPRRLDAQRAPRTEATICRGSSRIGRPRCPIWRMRSRGTRRPTTARRTTPSRAARERGTRSPDQLCSTASWSARASDAIAGPRPPTSIPAPRTARAAESTIAT